jgi:hypothetical protein
LSEDIKKVLSELQELHNRLRKEILHKIANTTPSKISNDQFSSIVTSVRHIENDMSKLIKNFKKTLK